MRKNLQFTSIAYLLIIAFSIDLCSCDQGKDIASFNGSHSFKRKNLFTIVLHCCWMQFLLLCAFKKKQRRTKCKAKEEQEEILRVSFWVLQVVR
jgi:hypothetical protein